MKMIPWKLCSVICLILFTVPALRAAEGAGGETFVIVHGSWGGGWAWKEVDRLLTADGHRIYRPTLTGLGERVHLANRDINLTTHITDVVNVILFEDLRNVVLVGHSSAGMVVTGVMDRLPDRIKHVVFLDAVVPNDGESSNTAWGRKPTEEQLTTGFTVPPWVKPDTPLPHDVPQPAGPTSEPVSYKNPAALKLPVTYIMMVDPGKKPEQAGFYRFYERAKARGWKADAMEGDHNVQWKDPKGIVRRLEKAGK